MQIITKAISKRNKPMCSSGGFIYNFYSLINSNTRWRCELRTCGGYIITNKSDEIIKEKQHSHDSNELKVKKNILMAKLKDRIINTKENSRNIIADMLSNVVFLNEIFT